MMSLLFNILSRFFIVFLPRSKRLLISWLQPPSTVILEPRKIVFHCFHFSPIYLPSLCCSFWGKDSERLWLGLHIHAQLRGGSLLKENQNALPRWKRERTLDRQTVTHVDYSNTWGWLNTHSPVQGRRHSWKTHHPSRCQLPSCHMDHQFYQIGHPSEFGAMVKGSSGLMTFFPFNQRISGYFTPVSLHSAALACRMVYILVVGGALWIEGG